MLICSILFSSSELRVLIEICHLSVVVFCVVVIIIVKGHTPFNEKMIKKI